MTDGNGNGRWSTKRTILEVVPTSPHTVQREERKQRLAPMIAESQVRDVLLDHAAQLEEIGELGRSHQLDIRKHGEAIFAQLPNKASIAELKAKVDAMAEIIGQPPPDPVAFARASHTDATKEDLDKASTGWGMAANVAWMMSRMRQSMPDTKRTMLTMVGGGSIGGVVYSAFELLKEIARAKGWL